MTDPVEWIAGRLARKAKEWSPDLPHDVEDIRYGLAVRISFYAIILSTLCIGALTGTLLDAAISMFAFWLLRNMTGGFHLPLTICVVVSVSLFCLLPHIHLDQRLVLIATTLAMILVILYSENRRWEYVTCAILLIGANYYFQSTVVALTFLVQAVTLIKRRR